MVHNFTFNLLKKASKYYLCLTPDLHTGFHSFYMALMVFMVRDVFIALRIFWSFNDPDKIVFYTSHNFHIWCIKHGMWLYFYSVIPHFWSIHIAGLFEYISDLCIKTTLRLDAPHSHLVILTSNYIRRVVDMKLNWIKWLLWEEAN